MERKVKLEVEEYIKENVSKKLDGCELFTKTFGKNFSKEKVKENINGINEISGARKIDAVYHYSNRTITIWHKRDGNLKTSEIKGRLKRIIDHEVGHAILLKTEEECRRYGIKYSTGIFVKFDDGTEMNKGLNEGYHNWLLEKAGIPIEGYSALTNIMKILELATDESDIMSLGKGDPTTKPQETFEMNKNEYDRLSVMADRIYFLELSKENMTKVISILISYKHRTILSSAERKQVIEKYKKLQENETYLRIFGDKRYKADVEYAGNKDTLDERINYLEDGAIQAKAKITETTEEILESLFTKYFEILFIKLRKSDGDSQVRLEEMTKLKKLRYLIEESRNAEEPDEYMPYKSQKIDRFLMEIDRLSDKYEVDNKRAYNYRKNAETEFKENLSDMSNYSEYYGQPLSNGDICDNGIDGIPEDQANR